MRKFLRRPNRKLVLLTLALGLCVILVGLALRPNLRPQPFSGPKQVMLSDLYQTVIDDARAGYRDRVTIESDRIVAVTTVGTEAAWTGGSDAQSQLHDQLKEAGLSSNAVGVQFPQPPSQASRLLWYLLPVILLVLVLLLVLRQTGAISNRAFGFGKSRARRFQASASTVTLDDVAGVDEAKHELAEVVEFLKSPERFAALGARIPRGVLLVGPPGTGKTLLSRAIAGEANVPFFHISGAEVGEMFVGVGASRVRDLFTEAKKSAPCIVFIDEIDAVGRRRGSGPGSAHEEREQTLNQILVEMDGFDSNTNVIVLAATNRVDVLDPALLRPGRFDRQVVLDPPDVRGREAILAVHAKGKPLQESVDLTTLAKQTPGFSGADLSNVLNEAAILAARDHAPIISMVELEEAVDRVVGGPARKSRVMSDREKAITAHHEAGHAIVARCLPNADPVHKVSIVSRGRMGGYTRFLPEEDRHYWSRSQFVDNLAVLLGGMTAEELIFGESTTGPSNDLERASQIARSMVTEYGMSADVGPVTFAASPESSRFSERSAEAIDREVQRLVSQAQLVARKILKTNRGRLERTAARLIEEETLSAEQFEALFTGSREPAPAPKPAPVPEPAAPRVPVLEAAATKQPRFARRGAALRRVAARAPRLPRLRSDDEGLSAAAE
ncbi:MAG TPA: ATP-dependent zinc metalloprotease FtsH [Chloroflexota bacterium]